MSNEPILTPSIISHIPEILQDTLLEIYYKQVGKGRRVVLISSNSLANRFIHHHLGIRSSQRRRHKTLFFKVRELCRNLFQYHLSKGIVICRMQEKEYRFGVYRFDEVRGNLILGVAYFDTESPFQRGPQTEQD